MQWMFLPLKRYADFSGRSRRMEYWMFALFTTLVALVLMGPGVFSVFAAAADPMAEEVGAFGGVGTMGVVGLGLYSLFALAIFVPSLAVIVRRLHDRDMSGWWLLGFFVASLIPLIGFVASIAFIVIMFLPGTAGENRFGPDPKDPHSIEVFE